MCDARKKKENRCELSWHYILGKVIEDLRKHCEGQQRKEGLSGLSAEAIRPDECQEGFEKKEARNT